MSLLQQSGMGDAAVSAVAGGQTSGLFMPVESTGGAGGPVKYCSVSLPDRQPFAPHDSEIVERLFVVSTPESFPQSFLEDAFCRFGNMIGAFFMPGMSADNHREVGWPPVLWRCRLGVRKGIRPVKN